MLIKLGSVAFLRKANADGDTSPASVIEEKDPDFVYFRARAVTADVPNGNGDLFTRGELEKSYKTFVGKHVDFEHQTDISHIVGKIVDAYPVEDPDTKEFYVEILGKIDRKLHPEMARMVQTGLLDKVSMESNVEQSVCSICKASITSNDDPKCEHQENMLGQEIDVEGTMKKVYADNVGVTFTGIGIVLNPADKSADIKNIFAKMKWDMQKMQTAKVADLSMDQKVFLKTASLVVASLSSEKAARLRPILEKISAAEFMDLQEILTEKVPATKKASLMAKVAFVQSAKEEDGYFLVRVGNYTLRASLKTLWGSDLSDVLAGKYDGKQTKGWYKDVNVWGKELLTRIKSGNLKLADLANERRIVQSSIDFNVLKVIAEKKEQTKWEKAQEEARKRSEEAVRESRKKPATKNARIRI